MENPHGSNPYGKCEAPLQLHVTFCQLRDSTHGPLVRSWILIGIFVFPISLRNANTLS